jgi:pimeloyl-ACP methyl ester carboxylesterase
MRIDVNGIGLEVDVQGEGPPVLLLHGWPDSHRLWRHQVAALGAAGYRTITPDLRGFGASDRPAEVDAYGLLSSVGDVTGILDHLAIDRTHVIGHDWGAALAWGIAAFLPDRVDHLAVLSVGHPAGFGAAGWEQRQLSWYMLLFQFEGIAEQWLSMDGWANFRDFFAHPEADAVIPDLDRDRGITTSLNWYRANVPPQALVEAPLPVPDVAAPVMGVWSDGDRFLTEAQMTNSARHVSGTFRYERLAGAGHWMQLEQPDAVNGLLVDFLPTP